MLARWRVAVRTACCVEPYGQPLLMLDLSSARPPRQRARVFLLRIWQLRTLCAALASLPVFAVLHEQQAPAWARVMLGLYTLAWPPLALLLSRRSEQPRLAEERNLVMDAVFGGILIAAMGFNIVPSALIVSTLAVDRISIGGWRLLRRCLLFMALAMGLASALAGFLVSLETSMPVVLWSLPLVLLYPIATSTAAFQLARRVRKQNRQLERLNRIDVLTGLRNRRHLADVAGAELARHLRARRPAVLLLLDIDRFKQVNDLHGHLVGDQVLRCVADAIRASIREIDTAARYGGDEFAVLLTETDRRAAMVVAERIRTTFLDMRSEAVAALDCTLSIGLAEADRSLTSTDDWVGRADAAMYQAKASGRNRVESAVAPG